jgi:hypothetical protein
MAQNQHFYVALDNMLINRNLKHLNRIRTTAMQRLPLVVIPLTLIYKQWVN